MIKLLKDGSVFFWIIPNSTPDNPKVNEDNSGTIRVVRDFECYQREKSLEICLICNSCWHAGEMTLKLKFTMETYKNNLFLTCQSKSFCNYRHDFALKIVQKIFFFSLSKIVQT